VHPVLFRTTQQLCDNIGHHNMCCAKRKTPIKRQLLNFGTTKTYIMGILNITPDSFSDGGNYEKLEDALARADELVGQGADIIDLGGQSTRPGAVKISAEEESARVIPVLKALRQRNSTIIISIDTFYSAVASEAIAAGADMINDVTGGLHDPLIFGVAASLKVPIVIMDSKPTKQYELHGVESEGVDELPKSDIVTEVITHLKTQAAIASIAGLNCWQLIFDPGLGFSKTYAQSIELIRKAKELVELGYPVLMGPSRKGFVGRITKESDARAPARMWGTIACCCAAVGAGVSIVRVHDVKECSIATHAADAIYKANSL